MELVNTNDDDFFDPTPKLKSSPVPILFISFNKDDDNCIHCGDKYTKALFCSGYFGNQQKYCKKCLSHYITNITDNNIYLDVCIFTKNLECNDHEISMINEPQNIQECCKNCLEILCFKQIPGYIDSENSVEWHHNNIFNIYRNSEKYCKLCGKSLHNLSYELYEWIPIKLCSDCYVISTGWIESTLAKKPIPILYLPWWNNISHCDVCNLKLTFTSDCQKYCVKCFIYYIGCRYCLTTNIIFGIADQSQCKKCKRVLSIIKGNNEDLDDCLFNLKFDVCNNLKVNDKLTDKIKSIKYFEPVKLCHSIYQISKKNAETLEWISYSQFTNVEKIAKGGFGTIYRAIWLKEEGIYRAFRLKEEEHNETVILKRFKNSQNISKDFLNELKSNHKCYKDGHHVIKIYGCSRDPESRDYVIVMKLALGGDLHNYLQKNFAEITWNKQKLAILWQISEGLETIHNAEFIHRDFHSGNILFDEALPTYKINEKLNEKLKHKRQQWKVGDLGLSQPANETSSKNDVYGVIPYIAPEIFRGSAFSKETDVYSFGMIMWELTTGCKPFANVKHDEHLTYEILDGKRPEVTEDTPECFANLMKSCWDPDPKKRPPIKEIRKSFSRWFLRNNDKGQFDQAETKRKELINLKKLGPEFAEKPHLGAIFTSRSLSPFISICSSVDSTMSDTVPKNIFPKGHFLKEFGLYYDNPAQGNTHSGERTVIADSAYVSREQEFDIKSPSSFSTNSNFTVQKFSTTWHLNNAPAVSSRKRKFEEIEICGGKHVKGI